MALTSASDAQVARSIQNRAAGRLLTTTRRVSGMNQAEFAADVARRMGVDAFSPSVLSGWETGQRAMPAAVLMAVAEIARECGLLMVLPSWYDDLAPPVGSAQA